MQVLRAIHRAAPPERVAQLPIPPGERLPSPEGSRGAASCDCSPVMSQHVCEGCGVYHSKYRACVHKPMRETLVSSTDPPQVRRMFKELTEHPTI
eukprot:100985-Amphidinium_carterae.1